MDALISMTLSELLKLFALTMASEGKPAREEMHEKLKNLVEEAKKHRDREIVMYIKNQQ